MEQSGKDYYDGNDYYATRVYGDTCMQDGLDENQVYVLDNSMKPELKAYLASATVDGEYLLRFYDIIKNIKAFYSGEIRSRVDLK